jgi:hypothetical protein
MKIFLLLLTVITLLVANGCAVFRGGRNHANDRNHPGEGGNDGHPSDMNHAEYPGDMDHSEHQ